MAKIRRLLHVAFNNGEPISVVTNARDIADAAEYTSNTALASFAIAYSALKRYGHDVPDFETFVDQLDEIEVPSSNGSDDPLAPTQPEASTAEPLP